MKKNNYKLNADKRDDDDFDKHLDYGFTIFNITIIIILCVVLYEWYKGGFLR